MLLKEHDESKMRMSLQTFLTELYINQERFIYNSTQHVAFTYKNGQHAIEKAVRLTPTCS